MNERGDKNSLAGVREPRNAQSDRRIEQMTAELEKGASGEPGLFNKLEHDKNSRLANLWQECFLVGELPRQVFVDYVVEAPLGKSLLLGANTQFQHLLNGGIPLRMRRNEWIIL